MARCHARSKVSRHCGDVPVPRAGCQSFILRQPFAPETTYDSTPLLWRLFSFAALALTEASGERGAHAGGERRGRRGTQHRRPNLKRLCAEADYTCKKRIHASCRFKTSPPPAVPPAAATSPGFSRALRKSEGPGRSRGSRALKIFHNGRRRTLGLGQISEHVENAQRSGQHIEVQETIGAHPVEKWHHRKRHSHAYHLSRCPKNKEHTVLSA